MIEDELGAPSRDTATSASGTQALPEIAAVLDAAAALEVDRPTGDGSTRTSRRYPNDLSEVVESVDEFAKWVAETLPDAEDAPWNTIVVPGLPGWFDRIVAERASQPPPRTPVWGDAAAMATSAVALVKIAQTARAYARGRSDPARPTVDAADVLAALATALAQRLASIRASASLTIVSSEFVSPAHAADDLLLVVHAAPASIVWRSRRAASSRRVVGGWLLLDGSGAVRRAALYRS